MKYRILQTQKDKFYPQEKLNLFYSWKYIGPPQFTWVGEDFCKPCSSLIEAENMIEERIKYLKSKKKYPIIRKCDWTKYL